MAFMVLTASVVTLNAVDYSNRCSKIELSTDVEEKETTTFASNGWKEMIGGLKSAQLAVAFRNDLADDDIDEDLWLLNGTVVAFTVKASSAATSASNPVYSGSVLIKGLKPIAGAVGDLNEFDLTLPVSGAVTRATS